MWYRLNDLINSIVITNNTIIVSRHLNKISFHWFDNYVDLFRKLNKTEPKTFFEVILGDRKQKVYFDIDHADLSTDGKQLIENIKVSLLQLFPFINPNKILVFSSNKGKEIKKLSYHIVVDGWCVSNNLINKEIAKRINNDAIDLSVYKSVQQLRILWNSKYGDDRVKILDPVCNEKTDYEPLELFSSSLVTNVNDCSLIPFEQPVIKQPVFKVDNINVEKALDLLSEYLKTEDMPFKFSKIVNNLIILRRTRSFYCEKCERVHDSENPFIAVINGDYYYFCRRNVKGVKLNDRKKLWMKVLLS